MLSDDVIVIRCIVGMFSNKDTSNPSMGVTRRNITSRITMCYIKLFILDDEDLNK